MPDKGNEYGGSQYAEMSIYVARGDDCILIVLFTILHSTSWQQDFKRADQ
jgi:hypothetical protein